MHILTPRAQKNKTIILNEAPKRQIRQDENTTPTKRTKKGPVFLNTKMQQRVESVCRKFFFCRPKPKNKVKRTSTAPRSQKAIHQKFQYRNDIQNNTANQEKKHKKITELMHVHVITILNLKQSASTKRVAKMAKSNQQKTQDRKSNNKMTQNTAPKSQNKHKCNRKKKTVH